MRKRTHNGGLRVEVVPQRVGAHDEAQQPAQHILRDPRSNDRQCTEEWHAEETISDLVAAAATEAKAIPTAVIWSVEQEWVAIEHHGGHGRFRRHAREATRIQITTSATRFAAATGAAIGSATSFATRTEIARDTFKSPFAAQGAYDCTARGHGKDNGDHDHHRGDGGDPKEHGATIENCGECVEPHAQFQGERTPREIVPEHPGRGPVHGAHNVFTKGQQGHCHDQHNDPKISHQPPIKGVRTGGQYPPHVHALRLLATRTCVPKPAIAIPTSHRTSGKRQAEQVSANCVALTFVLRATTARGVERVCHAGVAEALVTNAFAGFGTVIAVATIFDNALYALDAIHLDTPRHPPQAAHATAALFRASPNAKSLVTTDFAVVAAGRPLDNLGAAEERIFCSVVVTIASAIAPYWTRYDCRGREN
mmetsp:Transcript_9890/g.26068  ORF Transcript_9890/g.26068 Transcript_9890/m.26068 type:complete len:423 (+) Transcript_9890:651-1919(+)